MGHLLRHRRLRDRRIGTAYQKKRGSIWHEHQRRCALRQHHRNARAARRNEENSIMALASARAARRAGGNGGSIAARRILQRIASGALAAAQRLSICSALSWRSKPDMAFVSKNIAGALLFCHVFLASATPAKKKKKNASHFFYTAPVYSAHSCLSPACCVFILLSACFLARFPHHAHFLAGFLPCTPGTYPLQTFCGGAHRRHLHRVFFG